MNDVSHKSIPVGYARNFESERGRVRIIHEAPGVVQLRTFGVVEGDLVAEVFPAVDRVLASSGDPSRMVLFLDHSGLTGFDLANLRISTRWYKSLPREIVRSHVLVANPSRLQRFGLLLGRFTAGGRHIIHDTVASFETARIQTCISAASDPGTSSSFWAASTWTSGPRPSVA